LSNLASLSRCCCLTFCKVFCHSFESSIVQEPVPHSFTKLSIMPTRAKKHRLIQIDQRMTLQSRDHKFPKAAMKLLIEQALLLATWRCSETPWDYTGKWMSTGPWHCMWWMFSASYYAKFLGGHQ
jgi:hypothetical protein